MRSLRLTPPPAHACDPLGNLTISSPIPRGLFPCPISDPLPKLDLPLNSAPSNPRSGAPGRRCGERPDTPALGPLSAGRWLVPVAERAGDTTWTTPKATLPDRPCSVTPGEAAAAVRHALVDNAGRHTAGSVGPPSPPSRQALRSPPPPPRSPSVSSSYRRRASNRNQVILIHFNLHIGIAVLDTGCPRPRPCAACSTLSSRSSLIWVSKGSVDGHTKANRWSGTFGGPYKYNTWRESYPTGVGATRCGS